MPRLSEFDLHFRPYLGFEQFDVLLARLHEQVPVPARYDVLAALELEGRDLDIHAVAAAYHLTQGATAVVAELASFGDRGMLAHQFGAVHVAEITAGSDLGHCDLTTYILARRRGGDIVFSRLDENGGGSELSTVSQVPSLIELVVLVDAALVAQAPYPVTDGDWRTGYLGDPTMLIVIRSGFYPQLRRWYQLAVDEWLAAHGET